MHFDNQEIFNFESLKEQVLFEAFTDVHDSVLTTTVQRTTVTHVGIGASKVAIKTCRKTNLAGTRAPPRNRVANTKIIFVLARLRIAPLASDWPGTFQEFIEGYGGEMLEPTRPLST